MKITLSNALKSVFLVSTTLVSLSLPFSLQTPVSLAQGTRQAVIFAPPSNVRTVPNGAILCTVSTPTNINIYGNSGEWYQTDVCGNWGYIHQSQIRFLNNPPVYLSPGQCSVFNLRSGQLAVRKSPGGESMAGLNNNNIVRYISGNRPWYYIQVVSGPNPRVNGINGWVNSDYLDCFWY